MIKQCKNKIILKILLIIFAIILLIISGTVIYTVRNNDFFENKKYKLNGSDIDFSYEMSSAKDSDFKILIKVTDESNGIDKIELPDGDILKCNGRTNVGMDYVVKDGEDYVFKVINTKGSEKEETINLKKPKEPIIKKEGAYPILTSEGVRIQKLEIEYDGRDDFDDYYSIDDGQTWNLYTGPINIASKIKAKSQNKKIPEIYSVSEVSDINIIGKEAFDKDSTTYNSLNTYPNEGKFYIEMDNTVLGRGLYIDISNVYYSMGGLGTSISFVDENYNNIKTIKQLSNGGEAYVDAGIEIPGNTKYLQIYISKYGGPVTIREIGISETNNLLPAFDASSNTKDGVTISVSDYYNGGTWGYAYNAVDRNISTIWGTENNNYNPHWFKVEFDTPKIITSYFLSGAYGWGEQYKFYLEASEDGNEWNSLENNTIHDGIVGRSLGSWNIYLDNKKAYKYYRVYFPQGGWTYGASGAGAISELKLFGN